MRDQYHEQLDAIVDDLVNLTGTVRKAVASSTNALLDADGRLAEVVIAGDAVIDEETEAIEERALLLLATQQPVATDLRQLVATLRMDRLRKDLFRTLLSDSWSHGVEPAIDLALLGRYYERIGDHAVSMARRVVYLVTGELS